MCLEDSVEFHELYRIQTLELIVHYAILTALRTLGVEIVLVHIFAHEIDTVI